MSSEALLSERAVADRVAAAQAECPEATVSVLSAADLEAGHFGTAISGSLFSARSIVEIPDLSLTPPEEFDAIIAAAARPHADLCLILVHPGGNRGRGLVDKLTKAGVEKVVINAVKPWEIPNFVLAEASRRRIRIEPDGAKALVDAVGTDLRALTQALTQLASDWEGEALSTAMIQRYFAGRADVTSFAVCDDALRGAPGPALAKLRWALDTGVAPVLITSALAGALRQLGKYLELRRARLAPADLAREVGVPYWKLKDLSAQARDWTPAGVAQGIEAVAEADAKVKGAATDPGFALEQLVLAVVAARSERVQ